MRIDAYSQVSQIYKANSPVKTQKKSSVGKMDKVEISEFGKIYQTTKKAVKEAPDVREDKVAELKSRIAAGTYDVDPSEFADKLLERFTGAV